MNNAKSTWKWNMWGANGQGMMERRQTCLRLCYLLWNCSNMIKMNGVNSVKCSLKVWGFKGLGVLASSRLNASNCHDHEILAIPNVLTTTNVGISSLCCIRNRLKTIQIRQLFRNLALHLCDFDVLSKSKFGLRPENAKMSKILPFSALFNTLLKLSGVRYSIIRARKSKRIS